MDQHDQRTFAGGDVVDFHSVGIDEALFAQIVGRGDLDAARHEHGQGEQQ